MKWILLNLCSLGAFLFVLFIDRRVIALRPQHARSTLYRTYSTSTSDIFFDTASTLSPHPLTVSYTELSTLMQGSGKARIIWDTLKRAENPLISSGLSSKAKDIFKSILGGRDLIPVSVESSVVSTCGTRKMLCRLEDGGLIESVLIPSYKFDRTTLCVSTQVGCDRGCIFCATGKMGLMRNLTTEEILGQVYLGLRKSQDECMPLMTNIVFMGMGDAGKNIDSVVAAVRCLTDRNRFCFAQSKVTVSTVGPTPEVFQQLADVPCTIAWSLHAADDGLRKRLVPTTRHTTAQLRDGLVAALATRPTFKQRTVMIAVTLIAGVNDRVEDAEALAEFIRPMLVIVPKIALDLIPYNDIGMANLGRPSDDSVCAFQRILRSHGYFCSVRVTRGDDEAAACGMLTTKNLRPVRDSSVSAILEK